MLFRRASVRYGRTPEPETPYQKAAQVWDEHPPRLHSNGKSNSVWDSAKVHFWRSFANASRRRPNVFQAGIFVGTNPESPVASR